MGKTLHVDQLLCTLTTLDPDAGRDYGAILRQVTDEMALRISELLKVNYTASRTTNGETYIVFLPTHANQPCPSQLTGYDGDWCGITDLARMVDIITARASPRRDSR